MNQFVRAFQPDRLAEAWQIIQRDFPMALWETIYVTLLSTLFAIIIGLPLGMLLVAGDAKGIRPMPGWLMKIINVVINFLRSIPFLILIVVVIPLTRLIVGTSVGTVASIVPLVVAAFPFVARLVESSLREVNPNIIETAQSMGATPMQILLKVMLPESVPSLINNFTLAITTIMGYTAMSGAIGGGGLGKIAIMIGYNRYKYAVLYLAVVVLVILDLDDGGLLLGLAHHHADDGAGGDDNSGDGLESEGGDGGIHISESGHGEDSAHADDIDKSADLFHRFVLLSYNFLILTD